MRRLLVLTRTLLKDWLRNREAVFFAVLFPILLLVIFSLVFAGGPTEFDIAVQNNDVTAEGEPTELSAAFVTALEETPALDVERIDGEANLTDAESIEAETGHNRVVVIPSGFGERVRTASARVRTAVIRDTLSRFGENVTDQQQQTVRNATDSLAGGNGTTATVSLLTAPDDEGAGAVRSILESVVARFNDRSIGVEEPTVAVDSAERGEEEFSSTDYFLPAFIVAMILINGVMTVPSAVAQFKRDGTLKRLAVSPLRKEEWILANVIQQSILAVAITGVMVLVAWAGFGVTAVPGPLALVVIVLGAIAFTSLGMIVGGIIEDPGSAISLGGAIALPLMFVSGIFWELDLMPPTLQRVAEFSPVTHFHRSLRELMILGSADSLPFIVGLLGTLAVVFLAGAVGVTDWQEFD
ncbi:ABC transporter permease [Halovenus sp. HT40]|uniref:ABC transporter permease n=1 Tax=Halovenus sp. HT40 TaxID=3126691 RepID=UPI00300E9402